MISPLAVKITAIDRDKEYEDPMANITYPDVDRLTFWGVPYQFDYVFGPGTEQTQVKSPKSTPKLVDGRNAAMAVMQIIKSTRSTQQIAGLFAVAASTMFSPLHNCMNNYEQPIGEDIDEAMW